jgi:hypothetical protein
MARWAPLGAIARPACGKTSILAGRSDMAVVQSLRDSRPRQIAIRTLILDQDHGL